MICYKHAYAACYGTYLASIQRQTHRCTTACNLHQQFYCNYKWIIMVT